MPRTYQLSKELYQYIVRIPKDEAYFVYFILESNEGLCFFSTLDESLKGQYRDLDIKCSVEFQPDLLNLLHRLQSELRLDILSEVLIQDC